MTATRAFRGYATITSWHDGDTFYGCLERAGDDYEGSPGKPVRFRCAVIDAPELGGETKAAGAASTIWAATAFPPGVYLAWHYGRDNYGRTLVDLIDPVTGRQFSDLSLAAGMSVPYKR